MQYDAARETGRQLGVELRAKPSTSRRQRQSRMDGSEDDDSKLLEHVAVAPPMEQLHAD